MTSQKEEELQREVAFPPANRASYLGFSETGQSEDDVQYQVTGQQGYRTAITGHGVKHGDFYFEVEVLQAKTPLPHPRVTPALRIGFCNFEEQNLDLPLGASNRSYAYCSNGRMVTNAKYRSEESNEAYGKFCKGFL